ncbi:peptide deformylase [Allokutzneria oryzae]|uniref:Peptide deformylase n=1 Tax=Allokutzneria oryzae TaxID=1378989 RepID=A0ABV5ZPR1_9PSEU
MTDNGFIAEFKRLRDVRGLSQTRLGALMGYDRSYLSKIETGVERPGLDFVRRADAVFEAAGSLLRAWHAEYDTPKGTPSQRESGESASSLIVEHDHAELIYNRGMYQAVMRRTLLNAGTEPVSKYLVRISVDRYPGDPARSNELYRRDPLTWDELQLIAHCGDEPMSIQIRHDRDAFKEVWLLFANSSAQFPLYPGEKTQITYSYQVSENKWGPWFQRAVRLPTKKLSVDLDFPMTAQPSVWGTETGMEMDGLPFRSQIRRVQFADRVRFSWMTENPPLHARYRLEWRMKPGDQAGKAPIVTTATQQMSEIGIVQVEEAILREQAYPFDLPTEAEDARRVVAALAASMERVSQVHTFGKGMGIAAPQIGIGRAAALVRTPDGEMITLLNPRVIDESAETDEKYEGCLSFFDVRGMVPRPLTIDVEHTDIDGNRRIATFEQGLARLVAHEIDHLEGRLYTDRMRPGVSTISVEQYTGTGQKWNYR